MDKNNVLAEQVAKIRSLILARDGAGSELYKNAKKMNLVYDSKYKGLAIIDAQSGAGKVGDKFFSHIVAGDEMSVEMTRVFNSWPKDKRQIFVLRHELEHMSSANRSLVNRYRYGNVAIDTMPRHKLSFEVEATKIAFEWVSSL